MQPLGANIFPSLQAMGTKGGAALAALRNHLPVPAGIPFRRQLKQPFPVGRTFLRCDAFKLLPAALILTSLPIRAEDKPQQAAQPAEVDPIVKASAYGDKTVW